MTNLRSVYFRPFRIRPSRTASTLALTRMPHYLLTRLVQDYEKVLVTDSG